MPGYLDKSAPSIEAEMSRYIDGDIVGKMVFKNLCLNVLGLQPWDLRIPLGRHGDLVDGRAVKTDALIEKTDVRRKIEIKFSRTVIPNRGLGNTRKGWAFSRLLTSPDKKRKRYDIAVCVGLALPGLEDSEYWEYLEKYRARLADKGIDVVPTALPYQVEFLALCGFFILPRKVIKADLFRARYGVLEKNKYRDYFAWGHEKDKCRELWRKAVAATGRKV